ncbi:MAG: peptidoglycan DD-metalloendopeptidase family protein [Chloroflexota bacterium]
MKKLISLSFILLVICLLPFSSAHAQDGEPDGPVYIVQPGDSLWAIAQRFGVAIDALAAENGITNQNQLTIGMHIVIPGLEGLSGVLVTQIVPYGESLESLSRRYGISQSDLSRLNHFTSPDELFAGASLIILSDGAENGLPPVGRATLQRGQSLLELALSHDTSPWALMAENHDQSAWSLVPGQTRYYPSSDEQGPGAFPEGVAGLEVGPDKLIQGQTLVLTLDALPGAAFSGSFNGLPLNFFEHGAGKYVALQGMHAMLDPGIYDLTITGNLTENIPLAFSQNIVIHDGGYPYDPPLTVNTETTDNQTNKIENRAWFSAVASATPDKRWDGVFLSPVPAVYSDCFPSQFGNRRSYNNGGYYSFHTGLDFCGHVGVEIYAPAPGKVVFAESTVVRGNATIIDHGWGVFSAYAHQSEMLVSVGDKVKAGQLIGYVGATGRVTGPHLHWEILVGGIQVNPLIWMNSVYP